MIRGILAVLLIPILNTFAQDEVIPANDFSWVNIRTVAPTIVIDLRYAGTNNIAHQPIYSAHMQPLVRAGVARKLLIAQSVLRRYNHRLKIWDAYRPREAQNKLWKLIHNEDYVANPQDGSGSLHSWGIAVDATIVDDWGRAVSMPTDFDDFTPAAMLHYTGVNPLVRAHLYILQTAMGRADFYGLRTEWWHFTTSDWRRYVPAGLARPKGTIPLSP